MDYIPKQIYKPLGMAPRRFTYLVQKGVIKPDAAPSTGQGAANRFSAIEALRAGLIHWFESYGFVLDTATGIAETIIRPTFNDYDETSIKYFPLQFMLEGGLDGMGACWLIAQGKECVVLLDDSALEYSKIRSAEAMGIKAEKAYETYKAKHGLRLGWVKLTPLPDISIFVHQSWIDKLPNNCSMTFINCTEVVSRVARKIGITWPECEPVLDKLFSDKGD